MATCLAWRDADTQSLSLPSIPLAVSRGVSRCLWHASGNVAGNVSTYIYILTRNVLGSRDGKAERDGDDVDVTRIDWIDWLIN